MIFTALLDKAARTLNDLLSLLPAQVALSCTQKFTHSSPRGEPLFIKASAQCQGGRITDLPILGLLASKNLGLGQQRILDINLTEAGQESVVTTAPGLLGLICDTTRSLKARLDTLNEPTAHAEKKHKRSPSGMQSASSCTLKWFPLDKRKDDWSIVSLTTK